MVVHWAIPQAGRQRAARPVLKLWIRADPGGIDTEKVVTFCEGLENQTMMQVKGMHAVQESSGPEVGKAVVDFVRDLRR